MLKEYWIRRERWFDYFVDIEIKEYVKEINYYDDGFIYYKLVIKF